MTGVLGLVVTVVVVVAIDQLTKSQAAARLVEGELRPVAGGAGFHRVTNRRGGLLRLPVVASVVLVAVLVATALVTVAGPGYPGWLAAGLGLSVGGAASNVADRVRRGGVIDFIAVGRWPTFNLADVALVAGVVLTVAGVAVGAA